MTRIVAIGAGRMGRGIAQVCASAGYDIALVDFKARPTDGAGVLLDAARAEIAGNLDFLSQLGLLTSAAKDQIIRRIYFVPHADAEDYLRRADFVFEGVPETLAAKQDAFERLSPLTGLDAVIASTTSTIAVDTLAKFVVRPERFLNAHWLNPAYLIPLVEVSPGAATAETVVTRMMMMLQEVGKSPVRCKASPGYIIPRIQAVAMNEAARMVEEGVATPEDIDRAIRTGFGIRYATMGLVEFIDWGGVDILYYASNYLSEALQSDHYKTPRIVEDLMAKGELGLTSGKGFYDLSDTDRDAYRREKLSTFVALLRHLDLQPKIIAED
jgi:3-hydroxybutyryl-CoA dehydrogenase